MTATETKRYNGWTNYETWLVSLWIDNNQGDYDYWQEQAEELYEHAEPSESFTREEQATLDLSKALQSSFEEAKDNLLESASIGASLWADLLGSALGATHWHEIAAGMINEVDKDDDE